jgi:hypothetical protein
MSFIIYGGDKSTVEKQLKCDHDWHGPCIDNLSRYFKCTKCFCMDRDLNNFDEYTKAVVEEEKFQKDTLVQREEEIKELSKTVERYRTLVAEPLMKEGILT